MSALARRNAAAGSDADDIDAAVHREYAAMLAAVDRDSQRRHFKRMAGLIRRRTPAMVQAMERARGIDLAMDAKR